MVCKMGWMGCVCVEIAAGGENIHIAARRRIQDEIHSIYHTHLRWIVALVLLPRMDRYEVGAALGYLEDVFSQSGRSYTRRITDTFHFLALASSQTGTGNIPRKGVVA